MMKKFTLKKTGWCPHVQGKIWYWTLQPFYHLVKYQTADEIFKIILGVKLNLNSDLTDTESASKPPVIKPLILPAAKPSEAVVKPLGGIGSTVVPPPEVLNDNAVHDDGESLEVGYL